MVFHNKIINKTWLSKNQENSAHRFVDNYLTNHFTKFLQDKIKSWRVGALKSMHWYQLFKGKSLVRVF